MPFGERAARREWARPHQGLGFLRDLDHEIDGLRAVDGGADHEGRVLALGERRDQRLYRCRIGPDLAADLARLDRLGRPVPIVDRHRDEGRPAGRLHRDVIGARDRARHVLGPRRLDGPFHIRLREFGGTFGIEEWLQRQDRARLLACGDHQRRLVAVGVEDIAERVSDAGRRMQIDEAGVPRRLGIAVRHADDGGFLQPQHVVDVVGPVAQERQFGRARIAEHLLDAESAQQAERRVLDRDGFAVGGGWLAGRHQAILPSFIILLRHCERSEAIHSDHVERYGLLRRYAPRNDGLVRHYHVAVPFIVGCPSEFAVHRSRPSPFSLALTENSLPSNNGCTPR
ncbi:hypothetical protein ACVJGD_003796 [Bradyrhizobium sp. USDA 10063]